MNRLIWAALAGILFGAGLVISGLSNPVKVLNFLDITGQWDPSLILVMGAAAGLSAIGFRAVWRRQAPVCNDRFAVPTTQGVDSPLLIGGVLFGLGWGLTGYCPGPGITTLAIHPAEGLWFVGAMVAGGALHRFTARR